MRGRKLSEHLQTKAPTQDLLYVFFRKDNADGGNELKGMKMIDNKRFKPWDDYHMKTKIIKNQIEMVGEVKPKKRSSRLIQ